MVSHVQIKLFATLQRFQPNTADRFPIQPGVSIRELLQLIGVPEDKAKLIFIDGVKAELDSCLKGGERIGIFPPVGGG